MYLWWRTWHDEDRRLWAERFVSGDPATAKKQHKEDLQFGWASALTAPGVSGLEFTDENGKNAMIVGGTSRELTKDRAFATGSPAPKPPDAPDTSDSLPF